MWLQINLQFIIIINRTMKLLILSLLVLLVACGRDDPRRWGTQSKNVGLTDQKQAWFTQIVDHYNYQTEQTYQQRYWYIDNYYNPSVGPVFLYICGEYECPGVPATRQWVVTMAQRLQGLILVLEHRYYGQSMPFGKDSMKLENLVYLNSEQALSDLAYFIQQMKNKGAHKIPSNSPWITIGGSYPGALSAWFRYKYPHLTIGAIASSAVILAVEDFKDYDEQIYNSIQISGDFCTQAINASNIKVEQILASSEGPAFKAKFTGGDKLKDDQFLYFWIDSIIDKVQYGQRIQLCDDLKGKTADQQMQVFTKLAQENQVYQYGSFYISNATFAVEHGTGDRSWNYQCCTQYGYWQTFSDRHPLRSKKVSLDFFRRFCNQSFGKNQWPKVGRKNIQYGGLQQKSFNLLMANGVEDPWRWASLQQSVGNITSRIANCTNCAHCVDLYTPKSNDYAEVKKIRDEQYLNVMRWVESHWTAIRKSVKKSWNPLSFLLSE